MFYYLTSSNCYVEGFKKDQVKLQVDEYGHLIVSGESQVNEMKHVRFQQPYKLPDNSNIEDTTAKFEDDILYIVIPKKATAATEGIEDDYGKIIDSQSDHSQEENKQKALDKDAVPDKAAYKIGNNIRTEEGMDEESKGGGGGEEFQDAKVENHSSEGSLLGTLGVQLIKNKGFLVTAVLAFSLGVLVSQKIQTFQPSHES